MKRMLLLTVTTATLLAASSAVAGNRTDCPRNHDCPGSDEVREVGCPGGDRDAAQLEEVLLQEGEATPEGERRRGERGERGGEGERGDRRRGNPVRGLLRGIDLNEDQRAQVGELMEANRETSRAIMMAAREAQQNGEEVGREGIRAQMQELNNGLVVDIRGLLDEDQAAAFDENIAAREERMAERGERGAPGEGQRDGAHPLLRGIELSEDQQSQVGELVQANREAGREIMMAAREAHQNGEEVDRETIGAQLQALREAGAAEIRGILSEDQAARFDENQAAIQERMQEGRGEGRGGEGDRPRRPRDGDRPGRGRGGDRPGGGEGQRDLG